METLPLPARRHRPHHMQFIASIELVISSIPHYAFPGPRLFASLRYYFVVVVVGIIIFIIITIACKFRTMNIA